MPGSNTTGLANTEDYSLGRGKPFLATLLANLPGAYRFMGNAPEFNINLETETLEHQASTGGLKVVDKEVTISQKIGLTISLDELNFENMALYFSGTVGTYSNVAASQASITNDDWIASTVLGRSYDLVDSSGNRLYDITASGDVVVNEDQGGTPTALVIDDDYDIDLVMGRVFIKTTADAGRIAAGESLGFEYTRNATVPTASIDEVKALTQSTVSGALKFIAENPAAASHQTEFQFHKVALKAEGDFGLISDDWTVMQLSGSAERNITADADSPTLTIRTYATAVAA